MSVAPMRIHTVAKRSSPGRWSGRQPGGAGMGSGDHWVPSQ